MQGGNACNAACSVIGGQRTRARTPAPVKRARVSSGAYCLHWSLFVPRTKQMGILGSYRPESAVSASLAWPGGKGYRRGTSNLSEVTFQAGQPSVVLRVTSDKPRGGRNPKGHDG